MVQRWDKCINEFRDCVEKLWYFNKINELLLIL